MPPTRAQPSWLVCAGDIMSKGKGPPDIGGLISLKVDNFAYSVTVDELRSVFAEYGDVKDCHIPKDRQRQRIHRQQYRDPHRG